MSHEDGRMRRACAERKTHRRMDMITKYPFEHDVIAEEQDRRIKEQCRAAAEDIVASGSGGREVTYPRLMALHRKRKSR